MMSDPYTLTAAVSAVLPFAQAPIEADPNQTVNILRAFVIGVIGLILLIVGAAAVIGPGRKGNTRKAWDITAASLVGLVPAVLGAAGVALAFGASFLGWAVPFLATK